MGGGGSSDDNGNAAQTVGRKIWEQYDGRRRVEEGNEKITVKVTLFYADGVMVASIDPGWLQLVFDTLTDIFDLMMLQTNVQRTVGIVCRPCRAARVREDYSYTRRMTGEGSIFKERHR